MTFLLKWFLSICAGVMLSLILASAFRFWGIPTEPIDWPVSLALLSLFIPVFCISRKDRHKVKALIVCAIVSFSGAFCFFLSDDIQFNQLFYTLAWAGAGVFCFCFRQRLMAIMCVSMFCFGAVMVYKIGVEIPPGQYILWVVARNALFVTLLGVPVAQEWTNYAPAETQVSYEQPARSRQKAA